jgi:hypothetical protein
MMTLEDLLAQGIDEVTARKILENNQSGEGGGLPFDVIKMNYDKEDILSEVGIKKGEFITGWKINKTNFSIEQQGKVFEQPLEFMVLGQAYQYSAYDKKNKGYKYVTPLYRNIFDGKKIREKKTGKTVAELKELGEELKFNNILLVLVKEEDKWNPYLMYLRGVNYKEWLRQLEEKGLNARSIGVMYIFKIKTKKVPTSTGIPAWVFDLVDVTELEPSKIVEIIKANKGALDKFDKWVKNSNNSNNSGNSSNELNNSDTITDNYEPDDVPVDVDIED